MIYPKISVVIPSFNQGQFIERTLLSILNQEYKGEFEILVSDGGSKDNTLKILKKYHKKITWWSERDKGYADAVNKGFKIATGEIFAIQSSDDYYLKDSFTKIISAFQKSPDALLICGREALQEPNGYIFSGYELPEIITPKSFLLDHPFPGIFQHTTFFRREFYEKVGGMRYQFDMCADADLFYRMLHFGNGMFLNDYIAVYQKHNEQRTATQTLKFRDKLLEMVLSCKNDEIYNKKYCPSEDDFDRYQTFIQLFYLQYESLENARIFATKISNGNPKDNRIKNLINQILSSEKSSIEFKDNFIKKTIRIINRIIAQYFKKMNAHSSQQIQFSDKINADWLNKLSTIK